MVRMNFSTDIYLLHSGFVCVLAHLFTSSVTAYTWTNPPPVRPQALSIDYSNTETTSVLLKLSNFAIKCLPGYLVAEHQILLLSDSQKPITLTTCWHLIMGVRYCVKHLLWVLSVSAVCGQFVQI